MTGEQPDGTVEVTIELDTSAFEAALAMFPVPRDPRCFTDPPF